MKGSLVDVFIESYLLCFIHAHVVALTRIVITSVLICHNSDFDYKLFVTILTIILFFLVANAIDHVQLVTVFRDVLKSTTGQHQFGILDTFYKRLLIQDKL